MRILVTNDDGINAEGLWALASALRDVGDVTVVAPDRDQSGIGTALTLVSIVRAHKIKPHVDGIEAYSVQGTPGDCVILANRSLFDRPFDLVVSGINSGANIGIEVLLSGTVGGAMHGYLAGIPAIAVSCFYRGLNRINYTPAANVAVLVARAVAAQRDSGITPFLNVNVPETLDEGQGIAGVRFTQLGQRAFLEQVEAGKDGRRDHFWIRYNRPVGDIELVEGTDRWAVHNGFVSITPLDLVLTNGNAFDVFQSLAADVEKGMGLKPAAGD